MNRQELLDDPGSWRAKIEFEQVLVPRPPPVRALALHNGEVVIVGTPEGWLDRASAGVLRGGKPLTS